MPDRIKEHMLVEHIRDDYAAVERELLDGPITPNVSADEVRRHLAAYFDFSKPMSLEQISADVETMLQKWQVHVTHPRYFGLFNPSVTLASMVADTLVAMYNPQLAAWRTSAGPNEIERHTLAWLAAQFGLPSDTIGMFTTGGAEANLSAVIVALTRAFPQYGDQGLRSLPAQPTIYNTAESHHSFSKIAHMAGLGRNAMRTVATRSLRMNLDDLARQVEDDRRNGCAPSMVVATAGTTSAGAIDPLPEIARFCREQGLWFHVDAAWGGAAILSPTLRPHLAGIELADSITCDAHKWFSVTMGCGMFFCRHRQTVFEAFRADAAYMPGRATDTAFDPYTSSVQWSRRFIGLKLFMSLAELAGSGYAEQIDRQTRMGQRLRESLRASGWNIVNDTPLPLVCFTRDGLDIPSFLTTLKEEQIAWMSEAQVYGGPVIRACVTSFKTTEADVDWVVGEMNRIAQQSAPSPAAC